MSGRQEQLSLLPDEPSSYGSPGRPVRVPRQAAYSGPLLPAMPIRTSGQTEYSVECSGPGGCGDRHRHVSPGTKKAPCGATYTVPCQDAPDDDTG